MNDHIDIDALLEQLDPAASARIPDAASPIAEQVLFRAMSSSRAPRRRLVAVIAAALAVLAATATAAAFLWPSSPDVRSAVGCADAVDVDATIVVVRTTDISPAACNQLWLAGELSNPSVTPGAIPPLTGCVPDTGALRVYPTDDPADCAALGLEPLRADGQVTAPLGFDQDDVASVFSTGECLTFDEARDALAELFRTRGVTGWRITESGDLTPERPCASASIEENDRTIVLVPLPRG